MRVAQDLRGRGLYTEMLHAFLLEATEEIFSGKLDQQDAAILLRLSRLLDRLVRDKSLSANLGAIISRGHWARLTERLGSRAAADFLVLLQLPACHVDAFAFCALTPRGARAALLENEADLPDWAARLTPETAALDKLHRALGSKMLIWMADIRYDFVPPLGLDVERALHARSKRLATALALIAAAPDAYRAAILAARARDWERAEAIAAGVLGKADLLSMKVMTGESGKPIGVPPALGDFLTTALIPACHCGSLEISLRCLSKAEAA